MNVEITLALLAVGTLIIVCSKFDSITLYGFRTTFGLRNNRHV
ncbi:hypothetical protein [Nitrosopumilus sp.]|nr:hypothetical protein [Nitrosopumilus sp.]